MAELGEPVVVKLGGSFALSTALRSWIDVLVKCGGRVIVVPGGGPFAETVRTSQAGMGFDDRAAHHMALLAMEQYGRALISLGASLSPATSAGAIRSELAAGRVPVWMPTQMVLEADDIAPSWEVTSDSLAAWLAGRIGARRLLLVKQAGLPAGSATVAELAAADIVDQAFERHLQRSGAKAFIIDPNGYDAMLAFLHGGRPAGIAVECP
jgi:5-(aminomethyl)-3-furanmethanol phosphate kinase